MKISTATCKEMDVVPPFHNCSIPNCSIENGASCTNLGNMVVAPVVIELIGGRSAVRRRRVVPLLLDTDTLITTMERAALPEDEIYVVEEPMPEKKRKLQEFLNSNLAKGCPYKLRSRLEE